MYIWIDAETGTYGVADDLYMIKVNDSIGDVLEAISDNSYLLAQFAKALGHKVIDNFYLD